jgi:hypothetical protein
LNNTAWTQEKRDPAWPTNPIRLSNSLRRALPALKDLGVDVGKKRGKEKLLYITYDPKAVKEFPDDE